MAPFEQEDDDIGDLLALNRAVRVMSPILPSPTNPLDIWNFLTASRDIGPNLPSSFRLGDGIRVSFNTFCMLIRPVRVTIFTSLTDERLMASVGEKVVRPISKAKMNNILFSFSMYVLVNID